MKPFYDHLLQIKFSRKKIESATLPLYTLVYDNEVIGKSNSAREIPLILEKYVNSL